MAVERTLVRNAEQLQRRGEDVHVVHRLRTAARRNSGPPDDERHRDHLLVEIEAVQDEVVLSQVLAVIGGDDDGELVGAVRLPRGRAKGREVYRKVGTRAARAISKVVVAARLVEADGRVQECRLALGSVAETTMRAKKTEDLLTGATLDAPTIAKAREQLEAEISPIDDIRSLASYRRHVAANLIADFLQGEP